MGRIACATEELKQCGWERVWTAPRVIIFPGYAEAMEQGEEEDRQAGRQWRAKMDEVMAELRPEDREVLLDGGEVAF